MANGAVCKTVDSWVRLPPPSLKRRFFMDCGMVIINGPMADRVYNAMLESSEKSKSNKEKREKRLREFEEHMKKKQRP